MESLYFDTTYLFRVYSTEPGHEAVKALLPQTDRLAVAWHGRAEFASILLRKRREGSDSPEQLAMEIDKPESESILRPELGHHVIVRLVSVVQAASRHALSEIIDQKESKGDALPE